MWLLHLVPVNIKNTYWSKNVHTTHADRSIPEYKMKVMAVILHPVICQIIHADCWKYIIQSVVALSSGFPVQAVMCNEAWKEKQACL